MVIKKIKQKIFEMKLKKLGFDMKDNENSRCGQALGLFAEKSGTSQSHIIKCLEDAMATKKLQDVCEKLSGRKEAGRFLQREPEPLVIQCNTCQKDFSDKKGVIFVEETINLGSLSNIIQHLITCDGIMCDCGTKRPYFEDCKKCGISRKDSSASLIGYRKDYPFSKKQSEQLKKYKKLIAKSKTQGVQK